jgi:hypothetical protein
MFHFLTTSAQRDVYIAHLRQTVKPGGTAIIATFALDGPTKCSGLPVDRYDPPAIAMLLGADYCPHDAKCARARGQTRV